MKYSLLMYFLLMMVSYRLKAQNQPQIISLPTDISQVKIAGPIFIGTDTLDRKGLIGSNGKWLNGKRFQYFLGPVAGVYFGVSDRTNIAKKQSELISFRSSIFYALGNEYAEPKEFVYRLNSKGEILDSFQLRNIDDLTTV